jgi:tRNA A-37 threonylcarbamoyl transferase component Bud32
VAKGSAEVGSTANRYQILGKLAVGGMAEIFLARGANTTGLVRYCVLKRVLRERATDAQFVQMFLDEAKLAAQLQHPNIASVYDIGMLGDSYFFTMEYVHGETVRSLIHRAKQRGRTMPLACVLTIIAGAAAGLHHAHERHGTDGRPLGIVHRDISPSNLMVSYEGNLKIVDFGVAKAADRVETKSGTVKGKISYLSPEQCRGARVDRRSDLFSLGICMWEMLTGARLYRRASDFENMTAIVHELPRAPSTLRSDVPRAIDDIVLRLLAKSVDDRFQTAGDVVEAIENASMRGGTMLSSSAVGRLVHDLFGTRPEPWLAVDAATTPLQHMLASRPLPRDLAPVPLDPIEAELAAVPDLSVSMVLDDELDELGAEGSTLDPGATWRRGAPNAAALALGSLPPPTRTPSTLPLAGAAAPPVLTVPGSLRAVAAAAPGPAAAPPAAPIASGPAQPSPPVLPAGGVRAMLEAVASSVPVNTPTATTLLGHSAPAVNAAMTQIRKNASALAGGAATAAPPGPSVPAMQSAGASAGPSSGELPTRNAAPGTHPVGQSQPAAAWQSPHTTPSAPFAPLPRRAAASAPNPILEAPPSGSRPAPVPTSAPAGYAAAPASPQHPAAAGAPAAVPRGRSRSRVTPVLIAILLVAAAVGAGATWLALRDDGTATSSAPAAAPASPPAR